MAAAEIIRAPLAHTPESPFMVTDALVCVEDGGLLIQAGKIAACGHYRDVRLQAPDAPVFDWRDGLVLPGFVDTHVHFPQLRVIGGLGLSLLDWLEQVALPEEGRMANVDYAVDTAHRFVHSLLSHGTTTALAFGAHFVAATSALFDAAEAGGLRLVSGLVLSDRALPAALHQTAHEAYRDSSDLIARYHGQGRLLYAVTPRFALSTTEEMLEVCQTLVREHPDVRIQSHINESPREIEKCAEAFPWARDYLAIYERFGLTGRRAVLAHDVHPTNSELERLAESGTSIAHCPCSNAALGSGIFPFRRHLAAGVSCALGTDVGGGTGFGMLKEALQAYLMQRVLPDGAPLTAAHLLFLCTRAGALALGLGREIGDFTPGRTADFVYYRAPTGSPLEAIMERKEPLDRTLAAVFTLGGSESVREVRIAGATVFRQPS